MEATKKYKLTDETIEYNGNILHHIEALKDFGHIKKGELGGYVESESNLSHEGKCWVYDNAKVYGNAKVFGNAKIREEAEIYGNSRIYGQSIIGGKVYIFGNTKVYDTAYIRENVQIFDDAKIYGDAHIHDNAKVYNKAIIHGNSIIRNNVHIFGNANIYGNAYIHNNVNIKGNAEITGDAEVSSIEDYIVFKNNWSSGRYFTYTRSNKMWRVGCFYGTGDELIKKAYKDSKISGKSYKAAVKYAETLNKIENKNLFRKIATHLKNLKKIKLWKKINIS